MVTYETKFGVQFEAETMHDLTLAVLAYFTEENKKRKHNPYPESYSAVYKELLKAQRQKTKAAIILKLGDSRRIEKVRTKKSLTFAEAMSGAKAIISIGMGDIVDASEMARRAAICSKCSLISKSAGCTPCAAGKAVAQAIDQIKRFAGRGINYPALGGLGRPRDYNCSHCGCAMLTMLPAKMSCFHEEPVSNLERPEYCWVRTDSENYKA